MSQDGFSAIIDVLVEKSAESDGEFVGFFEGIASTPTYDLEGDRFSEDVLKRNAERLVNKPILLLHGRDPSVGPVAVGRILEARYVDGVLRVRAGIYRAFEEVWRRVRDGFLKALSIGGLIKSYKRMPGGGRLILDAEITEVSLTPRGVNPDAKIIYAFGKGYRVEDGVLTGVEYGGCGAAEALAELLAGLRAEIAELRQIVEPLVIGKSAARTGSEAGGRRPKALASGLYSGRGPIAREALTTPVFDDLWERVLARRASQGYKDGEGWGRRI